jgi:Asp-tRNA(Asn)/Glu-tRNA(Gln) amidotransferase C subunit
MWKRRMEMIDKKKISPPLTQGELKEKLRSGDYKIESAPTDEIDKVQKQVDRVLEIIGRIMGFEEGEFSAFVTDESTVGDFLRDDKQIEKLTKKLGFTVTRQSYIKDIAVTI